MHELSIAAEILSVSHALAGAGVPLRAVRVAVGELSAVEPSQLRFAWEALVEGSDDRGASLEIEWRPATQTCDNCGEIPERAPGTWLRLCPRCETPLHVQGGDELDVVRVSSEPCEARGALEASA